MTQVTGTGCLLSAVCCAALAVEGDPLMYLRDVLQDYKAAAKRSHNNKSTGLFPSGSIKCIR